MSTALLKFKPQSMPKAIPFDPGILAAATDASPEPVAVSRKRETDLRQPQFCTAFREARRDAALPHSGGKRCPLAKHGFCGRGTCILGDHASA